MKRDELFEIGYIERVHGYKGELIVQLDVDNPKDYQKLGSVYLDIKGKLVPFFITACKLHGKSGLVVQFEDVDAGTAEDLTGTGVYLPTTQLPKLADDQYYFHELRGMKVVDDHKGELGLVLDVYETPQQYLLAFEHQAKEILAPLNDDIVYRVDKNQKIVHTRLPEGLLEVYLD